MTVFQFNSALIWVIICLMVVFTIIYSRRARWWRTPIGRNLVAGYTSLAIYLSAISVDAHTESPVWLGLIRTAALLGFAWTIIVRCRLMLRAQRTGPKHAAPLVDPLDSETTE